MNFRKTNIDDVQQVNHIYICAKQKLKSLKINQWQDGYPNTNTIFDDINQQISYVLENNNEIIGTLALSFAGEATYDKIYDGNWLTNNPYGVIHRIATNLNYQKQNIATKMLQECEQLCKQNGITNIRIDTHTDNQPMQSLLKKNNYILCGTIYLEDGAKRLAFEKQFYKPEFTSHIVKFI